MIIPAVIFLSFLPAQESKVFIPSWSGLAAPYTYVQYGQNLKVSETDTTDSASVKATFSFVNDAGDTVYGIFARPKMDKVYPCALLLHGLGDSAQNFAASIGATLLSKGVAYAAIDAPGHGKRATPADKQVANNLFLAFMTSKSKGDLLSAVVNSKNSLEMDKFLFRAVVQGVKDNRHAIDYLTTRKDIDFRRIGVVGNSMGSIMGTILGAVDRRVKDLALAVGGDPVLPLLSTVPRDLQANAVFGACSLYAPQYQNRPVLMVNGNHDTVIPRAATDRLYKAFPEGQKTLSLYNSDHFLPPLAWKELIDWTGRQLGATR